MKYLELGAFASDLLLLSRKREQELRHDYVAQVTGYSSGSSENRKPQEILTFRLTSLTLIVEG